MSLPRSHIVLAALMTLAALVMGPSPSRAQTINQATSRTTLDQQRGGLINLQPTSFLRTRAALAQARNGTLANAIPIAMLGDSITRGVGSGASAGGAGGGQGYNGSPNQLATALTALGTAAISANIWGAYDVSNPNTYSTTDNRMTLSGNCQNVGVLSIAGGVFRCTTTGSLAFLPTVNIDKCNITYLQASGLGTFNMNFDGGSNTLVNTGSPASSAVVTTSLTVGSLASHTLNIIWVSGTINVVGIDCYNSASTAVRIWNWGWSGSKTADWTTNQSSFYQAVSAIPVLAPSLVVIELGTNDYCNGVAVATTTANLQTLITASIATSDVLLMTPLPRGDACSSQVAPLSAYANAIIALAVANNLPVYDNYNKWGGNSREALQETLGQINTDKIHPTKGGYSLIANDLAEVVLSP